MRTIIASIFFFFFGFAFGQNTLEELKNSIERSQGGSGAKIEYMVHLSPSHVKAYYANEFDTGTLVEDNGKVLYFELSKTNGEEKETVIINIESSNIIEFSITYPKGKCVYRFDFYY